MVCLNPGIHTIPASELIAFLDRVKQAGLHVLRMDIISKPHQGYKLTVVGGGYVDLRQRKVSCKGA